MTPNPTPLPRTLFYPSWHLAPTCAPYGIHTSYRVQNQGARSQPGEQRRLCVRHPPRLSLGGHRAGHPFLRNFLWIPDQRARAPQRCVQPSKPVLCRRSWQCQDSYPFWIVSSIYSYCIQRGSGCLGSASPSQTTLCRRQPDTTPCRA